MPVINQGIIKTLQYDVRWNYQIGGMIFRDRYGTYTVDARTYTPPIGFIMKIPTQKDNRLFIKLITLNKL